MVTKSDIKVGINLYVIYIMICGWVHVKVEEEGVLIFVEITYCKYYIYYVTVVLTDTTLLCMPTHTVANQMFEAM